MIGITEKTAAEKWCPQSQVTTDSKWNRPTINTHPADLSNYAGEPAPSACCLGSKCMVWRFCEESPKKPYTLSVEAPLEQLSDAEYKKLCKDGMTEPTRPDGVGVDWKWLTPTIEENGDFEGAYWEETEDALQKRFALMLAERLGYCGLAGRPVDD